MNSAHALLSIHSIPTIKHFENYCKPTSKAHILPTILGSDLELKISHTVFFGILVKLPTPLSGNLAMTLQWIKILAYNSDLKIVNQIKDV